jgi:hypothetical protein
LRLIAEREKKANKEKVTKKKLTKKSPSPTDQLYTPL